jgi:dipeptide/tripeptide permease
MAKKRNKQPVPTPTQEAVRTPILSRNGWKFVVSGLILVAMGFIVLSFTDSGGQNAASHISPFLLVGGYALIGIGLAQKTNP